MKEVSVSHAKKRLLDRLKRGGETTAGELADDLGLTDVAVRQHLAALSDHGLVQRRTLPPTGRGRPAVSWSLTAVANDCFPERHAELTVGLIRAARQAVGEDGLERILHVRADEQIQSYRNQMPPGTASLKKRVESLARIRTAEGYMAEASRESDGSYLIIENHCPICEAARACSGLCDAELRVFRAALGPHATVERVEHLLNDDRRCVYRIRPSKP